MLAAPVLARRAEKVALRLEHEDGVRAACDALERLYRKTRKDG
jgi:hypothetical protein